MYRSVTPSPVRQGITNFFKNTDNISTTANSLLQLKIKKAMRAIGRFTMNSAVGVGGFVDVASDMGCLNRMKILGLHWLLWSEKGTLFSVTNIGT